MRFGSSVVASLLTASGLCVFLACSSSTSSVRSGVDAGDDGTGTSTTPTRTPTGESDPVQVDGGKPPARIYAHTGDTLYLFDPTAKKLARIGAFDCLTEGADTMIDIAVDATGNIFGTSFGGFLTVSATDAKCKYVVKAQGLPNSLGFMPVGTVDAAKEALVGYAFDTDNNATKYVRIDTVTGAVTPLGSINSAGAGLGGTQYEASGDIIGLSRNGNRAFVTVTELPGVGGGTVTTSDSLAEIDPKTGAIKSVLQETGATQLYGLGQWAGQAYAFSGTGAIVAIDLETGRADAFDAGVATDAGVLRWFGAGVTTAAPTKP